ncbi:hypothetical protein [Frankia sp. AiPa1]|uniref:hypothetical protein n=1 Tax=Frankia sp. AiPa1 TaxID=573492 RepID=UPI00202B7D72|nr:hypothetical protein [Frankia sp. AiPa1]MCL9759484.1 hypothetical protein [Frankia sp. AiPa1]
MPFAGRVSTEDQQDPQASRNWQLARARALIKGMVARAYRDAKLMEVIEGSTEICQLARRARHDPHAMTLTP